MPTSFLKLKADTLVPTTLYPKHNPSICCSLHLQKLSAHSSNVPLIQRGKTSKSVLWAYIFILYCGRFSIQRSEPVLMTSHLQATTLDLSFQIVSLAHSIYRLEQKSEFNWLQGGYARSRAEFSPEVMMVLVVLGPSFFHCKSQWRSRECAHQSTTQPKASPDKGSQEIQNPSFVPLILFSWTASVEKQIE